MMMGEQQFGWNYFENEVVIGDKRDKKRMIVIVFSNFMCIPYNRKAFDELVDWLNEQDNELHKYRNENAELHITILENEKEIGEQQDTIKKQEEIIKSQDAEISRQYNLCLAMSGVLREEFGVYDVFDRTKDKNIKKEE